MKKNYKGDNLCEKKGLIFISIFLTALVLPLPAAAQRGVSGTWEWRSRPNSNKEQVYFSVEIKQRAGAVAWRYWFNLITDDEGDDASFVPFIGTVTGDIVTIEFDPQDTRGIDDRDPRYRKPRSPATAALRLRNGKLEWAMTKGRVSAGDLSAPRRMTMIRLE